MAEDTSSSRIARRALTLGVIAILVVCLCGCEEVIELPPPEPVTISFIFFDTGTEYYERMVQEFNEILPHITVELRPWSGDPLAGLDEGDADVFLGSQWDLIEWLEEDAILDLAPFIDEDPSFDPADYYPGVLELLAIEGGTWSIPIGVDLMVLFYNRELFDRYEVPYPEAGWTWDDFLEAGLRITDIDTGVFGYLPHYTWPYFTDDPFMLIYQHGGRVFDDLIDPTRPTLDDPLTLDALKWYAGLIHKHNIAPTHSQARHAFDDYPLMWTGVLEGRVGMWTGLLSDRGGRTWSSDWPPGWGLAPLPQDKQAATLAHIEGYFISSQAPHPQACWSWVAFLSKQAPYRHMPARRSLAESEDYDRQVGEDVAGVARSLMGDALLLSPRLSEAGIDRGWYGFWRAVDWINQARYTPEEAIERAVRISAQE